LSDVDVELVDVCGREDEPLVDELHAGIYLDEFAEQREPVDAWKRALWSGDASYRMAIRVARARASKRVVAGIAYERYPQSGCGLVTYLVVAPHARRGGLGRRLLDDAVAALHARGAPVVFGEVNDPRRADGAKHEPPDVAWRRLDMFARWGARVVDARYVQPALAPELARDRGLALIAFASRGVALPAALDGAIVRAFVGELHAATEHRAPDAELRALLDAIPPRVALIELRR
jgi:GNAT superfamily N-acetyltransferase